MSNIIVVNSADDPKQPVEDQSTNRVQFPATSQVLGVQLEVRYFDELEFVVSIRADTHWVEFDIYHVEGKDDAGQRFYTRKGSMQSGELVDNLSEAQKFWHGSIKWDGRSNWTLEDCNRDNFVMTHACTRGGLERIGLILLKCWDIAKELMPNFEGVE